MSEPFRMFKNLTCLIAKPQLGLNIPQAEQLWQGAGGRGQGRLWGGGQGGGAAAASVCYEDESLECTFRAPISASGLTTDE